MSSLARALPLYAKAPKELPTGKVIQHTFNAKAKITTARVERRQAQLLYQDGARLHGMDAERFETLTLPTEAVAQAQLLKEGQGIELLVHQETDQLLTACLPPAVTLQVRYTEPGFKGDTVTKTLKPATLETGATIQVPLFIDTGDLIKIDTRTGNYLERHKAPAKG